MTKRCVDISSGPCHIAIRDSQLVIRTSNEEERTIPVEDLGVLIVDHPAVTYTHAALRALLENNATVVVCGMNHHPGGLLLPVEGHSVQAEAILYQASATQRLKDRLWKEVISAKIMNQAFTLALCGKESAGLKALAQKVKTGDIENTEGMAAQRYWRLLFGTGFRRDREGPAPNNLLNYGYMVLRAAVARAICSTGLHPSLGIHHRNRYNAFALADDLMEPFRPLVDIEVYNLFKEDASFQKRGSKARLLGILASTVDMEGKSIQLLAALQMYAASLKKVFADQTTRLQIPKLSNDYGEGI